MSYYLKVLHELKADGVEIADFTETKRSVKQFRIDYSATNSKVWLISFTDILALMLTFFVMLFSMSEPRTMLDSTPQALSSPRLEDKQNQGAPQNMASEEAINLNRIGFNKALELGYLKNIIDEQKLAYPSLSKMKILEDKDNGRLILMLPEELLFASASDRLSGKGQDAVADLANILKNIKNGIEVVGHSDPRPAKIDPAMSNMLLSIGRAKAVADFLKQQGYGRAIPYQGYGSALYTNLPQSWTEAQKLETARRVDIFIHAHDGSRQKRFGIAGMNINP